MSQEDERQETSTFSKKGMGEKFWGKNGSEVHYFMVRFSYLKMWRCGTKIMCRCAVVVVMLWCENFS